MSNYQDFSKKTDQMLINMIMTSPNSADGITAKEILEYRKYLVAKRQNTVIVVLTIVMAVSAAIDVIFRFVEQTCVK